MRRRAGGEVVRVGQAGGRILGGEAGDVVGRAHRLLDRGAREVGGAGVAAPLADVDRDAERLVAVALDVLESRPCAPRPTGRTPSETSATGVARAERLGVAPARRRRVRGTVRASRRSRTERATGEQKACGDLDGAPDRGVRAEGGGYDNDDPMQRYFAACEPVAEVPEPDPTSAAAPSSPGTAQRPSKTERKRGIARAAGARRGAGRAVATSGSPASACREHAARRARRPTGASRSHEGRRRQMQFDRQADARRRRRRRSRAAVAERRSSAAPSDSLALHQAERWRAELIADDDALDALDRSEHPGHRRAAAARAGPQRAQGRRAERRRSAAAAPTASCSSSSARTKGGRCLKRRRRRARRLRPGADRPRLGQRPRLRAASTRTRACPALQRLARRARCATRSTWETRLIPDEQARSSAPR